MNNQFSSEKYWTESWVRHIESYLSAPPRCGYWITSEFSKSLSILEIAGGSCRDSRYLSHQGFNVIGSDFDQKTLDYLTEKYPNSPLRLRRENAFSTSVPNKSIDLSFSNGFWVLFSDNKQIKSLIHEQSRITKKYLISLVHNIENIRLVELFTEKSKSDSLYQIRFFHRDELRQIITESGIYYRSITIKKFGGYPDKLFANNLKRIPNPFMKVSKFIVPKIYKYQSWALAERIACIVELE